MLNTVNLEYHCKNAYEVFLVERKLLSNSRDTKTVCTYHRSCLGETGQTDYFGVARYYPKTSSYQTFKQAELSRECWNDMREGGLDIMRLPQMKARDQRNCIHRKSNESS